MANIKERLKRNKCPENTGCGTMPYCACSDMEDAADEIIKLEAENAKLRSAITEMMSCYCDKALLEIGEQALEQSDE